MGVVDDEVFDQCTRTAFSSIEEHVGGDGGSGCTKEHQIGVTYLPVNDEAESFCQRVDGEGDGCRQRQALRVRLGVLLAVSWRGLCDLPPRGDRGRMGGARGLTTIY